MIKKDIIITILLFITTQYMEFISNAVASCVISKIDDKPEYKRVIYLSNHLSSFIMIVMVLQNIFNLLLGNYLNIVLNYFAKYAIIINYFFIIISVYITMLLRVISIKTPETGSLNTCIPIYYIFCVLNPIGVLLDRINQFMVNMITGYRENSKEESLFFLKKEINFMLDNKHFDQNNKNFEVVKYALEVKDTNISKIMTPRKNFIEVIVDQVTCEELVNKLYFKITNNKHLFYGLKAIKNVIIIHNERVIGIVNLQDFFINNLLQNTKSIEQIIKKHTTISKTTNIYDAYQELQSVSILFIIDEYGSIEGIVTEADILSEIFGEKDLFSVLKDGILVQGECNIRNLNRAMEWEIPENENNVSGFIMTLTKDIPEIDEILFYENHKITILKVRNNKVSLVLFQQVYENYIKSTS